MPLAVLLFILSQPLSALELGFQALTELEGSDNVEGANAPDENDGVITSVVLGVYGERRSAWVDVGFLGELDTRRTASSDNADINSVSRFSGAAEFKITPRSWRWFVGDIIGGVRTDDAIQIIDDADIERRNVFVTGPSFISERAGISQTSARALYIHQTQDAKVLKTCMPLVSVISARIHAGGSWVFALTTSRQMCL